MNFHNRDLDEIIKEFNTDKTNGFSENIISSLREKYGTNELKGKKKKSAITRFLYQFKDVMIIILLIAAVISFVIAIHEHDPKELFEPALILLIVIINAVMGVFQESKAEKALESLKNLSAPHAKVIRDGNERIVEAKELVPGDIIRLEAGDYVPADARLIKSTGLKCEESALTGESVPSDKDFSFIADENAPLGDRKNMVYSGCSVTYGTCSGVVVATGMNTEMGRIAGLLDNETEGQTPLQKKLSKLGKYLGIVALIACAVIFAVGVFNGIPVLEIFMTAVSLAVSAIPEGLPAIVTIVLSIGVQRMVKKNAIIRRLPAVETLGSASIICSDKTGTLTQNRMTLVKAYTDKNAKVYEISSNNEEINEILLYGSLCCDGSISFDAGKIVHIGDPTETSIVLAAHNARIPKKESMEKYPRIGEIPFDSDRKLMSVIIENCGKKIVITKGAFDVLAKRCESGNIKKAEKINEEMSRNALRVIAVAYKYIDEIPEKIDTSLENNLTFMGLLGMIDPPREEAKEAVEICRAAGIKPVMITGDHIVTATAIAREIGIYSDSDRAVTGAELDCMSETELEKCVEEISVYARVSPENKIRIVKAWQRKGHVVSMTGDGVNDAPALKAADIGCAMGITGTDVAKGAADITLTDDNFATIVDAVREGRGIYANIKKVVSFLLGTNIGEVITVFLAMILWHKTPLLSMQLLWINLVTDSLPAIALGMEAVEENIMEEKPKPKDEGIFANGLGFRVIIQGVMFAALTLIAFIIGDSETGIESGRTMAFLTLSLSQVFHAFNMRSNRSLFKTGFFSNKSLNLASLTSLILVLVVAFTPLSVPFGLVYLNPKLYLISFSLALFPVIIMEILKALKLIK